MQTDSQALGAKGATFKWVVPRLALMMFLQFFCLGGLVRYAWRGDGQIRPGGDYW
ncbi:Uncharacterised protein [Serratia fonticola]|uniref:Uncharacterized protein n=1 Tax=Serratia fonticola TaxID=47917 RepID=A0A4U9WL38_SERFO|nr:Uncharacterised protein [Serratia fonticola]